MRNTDMTRQKRRTERIYGDEGLFQPRREERRNRPLRAALGPAGETASRTVYGEGIAVLNLEKVPENAAAADLAAAVIDWYREHPEWSFGGLDGIEKTEDGYRIFLYAGILSFSGKRFFTAKTGKDSLEADTVYVGFENPETMRYVYQKYEEDGEFSYELERKYSFGSGSSKRYYIDAIDTPGSPGQRRRTA